MVIDFRVRPRTELMLKPWNPDNPAPHFERYIDLYKMRDRLSPMTVEEFVRNMDEQGIEQAVLCGSDHDENIHLAQIVSDWTVRDSERFFFIAGVSPKDRVIDNLEELRSARTAGCRGMNFSPYIHGIPANDKTMYPLYAFCEEHNQVAIIHSSLHYNRYQSMWLGDPKYIDEVAMHFPQLKIVVSHAFNGFGVIGLAVAQKHPNVWLEFSALWPKYLPESTLQAVNTYLKDRCLFGTDYPLVDFAPAIKAWDEALRPEVKELFFHKNAERCLFGEPQ